MARMTAEPSPIARTLGCIPCGLYIVSTAADGAPIGFVGSFVMQTGFDPPTVCVAIGRDRAHLAAVRRSGRFALSILDADSRGLMGAFFKPPADGGSPFDALATETAPGGSTVLTDALGWLECEVSSEHDSGDHVVVFGRVTAGHLAREADSAVHLRKNGLGY